MKKRILLVAGLLLGIGFWTGSAEAQTGGVRATVPFHFMVGGKTFAAGEYTMVAGQQRVSVVSAADGRTMAIALANNVSGHLAGGPVASFSTVTIHAASWQSCGRRQNRTADSY
jgi:hypothetical protein